jgi:hypothetical protein
MQSSFVFSGPPLVAFTVHEAHISALYRWRDGKLGNHCRGGREPIKEHAESRQTGFLEVRAQASQNYLISISSAARILLFYILSILLIGLNG